MINLNFKYFSAKNFLCFGEDGIQIDLEKYNNIVLIKGCNYDDVDDKNNPGSNGSGKTSISEIIVYALFGKPISKPKQRKHKHMINNTYGKKLEVEVIWDNYRVVRTRKPDSVRLWEEKDGVWDEITLGGMPETDKLIEQKLGLNYQTFVNLFIFDDKDATSFLECDGPTKREIVENLLSLYKYRECWENAKKIRSNTKDNIKYLISQYQIYKNEIEDLENNKIKQLKLKKENWKNSIKLEINNLIKSLEDTKKSFDNININSEIEKYQKAQEEIAVNNDNINSLEHNKKQVELKLEEIRRLKDNLRKSNVDTDLILLNNSISDLNKKISDKQKDIITTQNNRVCSKCYTEISIEKINSIVDEYKMKIIDYNNLLKENTDKLNILIKKKKSFDDNMLKLNNAENLCYNKNKELQSKIDILKNKNSEYYKIKEPKLNDNDRIIEERINFIKSQIIDKKSILDGVSPYCDLILTTEQDLNDKKLLLNSKKQEITDLEYKLPYYDFWVNAFSETGIRKYIIDRIIPALNARIAYWMQFLIGNRIKLTFDNELEETIARVPYDGDPYIYHGMSGGERRRLNLACSQAFAHIMQISCGSSPSIVFLDEVSSNIDSNGIPGVYKMICELSKEKKVFLTTHDSHLLDLLTGCQVINVERKNHISKLVD